MQKSNHYPNINKPNYSQNLNPKINVKKKFTTKLYYCARVSKVKRRKKKSKRKEKEIGYCSEMKIKGVRECINLFIN